MQLNLLFCRWLIDPPLEVIIPAKRTPWPETTTELPSELLDAKRDQEDRRLSRTNKSSRPRSTTKRKGEEQEK
jgi:putative beta-1,4-xylosyltransferase IRX14